MYKRQQLQTAITTKEKMDKQIYVNIANDEWSWEIPFLIINNLVYDIIIGIDHLKSVQTKLVLCEQIMEFMVKGKLCKIRLNESLENYIMHNNEIIAINRPEINIQQRNHDNNLSLIHI